MSDAASLTTLLLRLHSDGRVDEAQRPIAVETPVAIEVNGIGYAVMMATPADLNDFATGFMLSERLVSSVAQIRSIDVAQVAIGWIVRIALDADAAEPVLERARMRVAESSCGLCGLESLEQLARPLPAIIAKPQLMPGAIFRALSALGGHQPLSRETGAVHAAAFCSADGSIRAVREDVGRHNALDKVLGALVRAGEDVASGFLLLTARCSYELVEKTVVSGCPMLVTISAPTSMAIERAKAHGLTLVALARHDSLLIANDPNGLFDSNQHSYGDS